MGDAGRESGQRAKTHCPQGHPYDEANAYVTREGWRQCRACNAARHRRAYRPKGTPTAGDRNRAKTHCPKGHPYDEANTYRRPDGRRQCRACNADRVRALRRAAEAA